MTAEKIVEIMRGWIGTDKRKIIDLYNSHTPLSQGYSVRYSDAWCDTTVSAAFIAADAVDLIGGTECGVERHIQLFKKKGIWKEDGTIIPNPGDIICYNWDNQAQPNDGYADHIGIVEKVEGQNITVIEGNFNDAVRRRTIPVGWGYIRGYAQPQYEEKKEEPQKEERTVKTVIDVSEHQQMIDWDAVKTDGVIIRCGYGSDIPVQDDKKWLRNIAEVERIGIPYGVYLYSYADSELKIQSEIEHCLRLIKGHNPILGVFYDLEEAKNGWIAPVAAQIWCEAINAAGYKPGIYCGAYYYRQYLYGVEKKITALWWIAGYGTNSGKPEAAYKPHTGFEYDAWQYTSRKMVDGISGGVDCSEWYVPFEAVDLSIYYRAHVQTYGWMGAVKDGEIAGTVGESKRLEAIKITPPDGVVLEVDAHMQSVGWKTYKVWKGESSGTGSSANDPIIGTVGEGRRLEAVRIRCLENPTGRKLKYQVHVQTYGWMRICDEGDTAGTTGIAKRLEAIKIWFE